MLRGAGGLQVGVREDERRPARSSAASRPAAWPCAATSPARTASTPPRCWWRCWPLPGKSVSELFAEIAEQYGDPQLGRGGLPHDAGAQSASCRSDCSSIAEKKAPDFGTAVDHISREDGCKVYFTDGSWVICRFSGTEPLLRMAAEADVQEAAERIYQGVPRYAGTAG